MFETIKSEIDLLDRLAKRTSTIKNRTKLPDLDAKYLAYLTKYTSFEITPDIILHGYEEALQENRTIESDFPDIGSKLWLIGNSGQGDSWFLDRTSGMLLFFDHQQGEYHELEQFTSLNINFVQFLSMAFLYAELEELLDSKDLSENEIKAFKSAVNGIHPNLYQYYPFDYFK